ATGNFRKLPRSESASIKEALRRRLRCGHRDRIMRLSLERRPRRFNRQADDQFFSSAPHGAVMLQSLQQTSVGRWEFIEPQFICGDPAKIGTTQRLWFVAPPFSAEKLKMDGFVRVSVSERFDPFEDRDLDSQLLSQLAREASFEVFIGLALATGEF